LISQSRGLGDVYKRQGVDRTIEILRGEIVRTMKLLGVNSLEELEPGHVKILERLTEKK
jgi:L-lactate dehydrogenase (cytochrome)